MRATELSSPHLGLERQPSPARQCGGRGPPLFSGPLLTGPWGRGACSQTPALPEPEHKGKWGDPQGQHRGLDTEGHQLEASRLDQLPCSRARWAHTPKVTDADGKSGGAGRSCCSGSPRAHGHHPPQQAPQCLAPSTSAACLLPSSPAAPRVTPGGEEPLGRTPGTKSEDRLKAKETGTFSA